MRFVLLIPLLASFFITLFFIPLWIKKAKRIGLIWEDMNKPRYPKRVAGSGGLIVTLSFVLGVLFYIAIKTFVLSTNLVTLNIFALLTTVFIALIIGFIDDILGWAQGGLSAQFRILLLLCAAIPLVVINAGESVMMGIEFGLLYPLFFIPLGVAGASATFNLLAGYNGLESSQGILIFSALAVVTFFTGSEWLSVIALCMVASLIAFYLFNKYPSRIFPGDSLTYPVGSLIAIIAILGNIEKIAVFFFIPYILEAGLKLRGGLKKQSFAKVNEDGTLDVPYKKFYGLEHLAIAFLKQIRKNHKVYETDVVYLLNIFQLLIILAGFLIFQKPIFY